MSFTVFTRPEPSCLLTRGDVNPPGRYWLSIEQEMRDTFEIYIERTNLSIFVPSP